MNCQSFWDVMPELNGDLAPEAAAHLAGCPACGALLRNQRALAGGLRNVGAEWSRVKAPGRVEARLLAAFRGQAGLAAPAASRRWWQPVTAWTAASVVVAAAALMLVVRARLPQSPGSQPAGAEVAATDWTSRLPVEGDGEYAEGGFIALPNARRPAPSEDVNVVRVEVPRSAMIALGFVVSPDRADERVQADVVLGSDGLARAVRFLEE